MPNKCTRPTEGRTGAEPAARGYVRGCRTERPTRGIGRFLGRLLLRPFRHRTPCGRVELCAPDRVIQAPLQGTLTQKGRGVVPERLGERITKIGASDADIVEHSAVQPGQKAGPAPVTARPSQAF